MKIAFIGSPYDPSNPFIPETVANYISRSFEKHGHQVLKFVPEKPLIDKLFVIKKVISKINNTSYFIAREPSILRSLADQTNKFLKETQHDLVFSFGTLPQAFVESSKPMAFWTDATFNSLLNYYDSYKYLPKDQIDFMNRLEKNIFSTHYNFFASNWAARSAIDYYKAPEEKTFSFPLGAKLPIIPNKEEVMEAIDNKSFNSLNLVWIGVDWERKGGKYLENIAREMQKRSIQFKIHVIGVHKQFPDDIKSNFEFHGFLNKSNKQDYDKFKSIMFQSHFHILMTNAEAFGHVFVEANAFGVSNIATNTGGVPSAVINGESGYLFDLESSPNTIVDHILNYYNQPKNFKELSKKSRLVFDNELNWDNSTKQILDILEV